MLLPRLTAIIFALLIVPLLWADPPSNSAPAATTATPTPTAQLSM